MERKKAAATSLAHFRAALDASRAAYGPGHPKVARDLYFLATATQNNGEPAAAEPLFRAGIRVMRAADAENADLPYMVQDFGRMLVQAGDAGAAEPLLREALEMFRRRHGEGHPAVAVGLNRLGEVYEARGDPARAEATHREAAERHRRWPTRQLLATSLTALARVQIRKGHYAGGERSLLEALELTRASLGDPHPDAARIRGALVGQYEAWGRAGLAAQHRAATTAK